MAEFGQMMKDWRRMCEHCDRNEKIGCVVNGSVCDGFRKMIDEIDLEVVEAKVTAWAAEHPEPVYPLWVDWLVQVGVLGCETSHGHKHYFVEDDVFEHIPEETAQLLGLKPLPIVNGDCGATNEADARKKLGIEPKEV